MSRVRAKMMAVRARKMGIVARIRWIMYRTIAFTGPPSPRPRDLGFARGNLKLRVDDPPVLDDQLAVEVHGLMHHNNVDMGLRACFAAHPPALAPSYHPCGLQAERPRKSPSRRYPNPRAYGPLRPGPTRGDRGSLPRCRSRPRR